MVKDITQARLDALPPVEREIQNSLIRQGRLRVAGPGEKKGEKPPRVPEPMELLRGKHVKIVLVTGATLEGTLQEVSRFEVVLLVDGTRSVVVLKHAVVMVEVEELKAKAG